MSWYAVAAKVGLGLVAGAVASKAASQTAIAQNKTVQKYNEKVQNQALEQLGQINLQRTQARQQTEAALYNASIQGQSAKSAIDNQAAATDTIGASVNDAVATVNVKQGQSQAEATEQYQQAIDQSNLMVKNVTENASNSLKDSVDNQAGSVMGQAVWGAVGAGVGQLLGNATKSAAEDSTAPATVTPTTPSISTNNLFDYQGRNTSAGYTGSDPFGLTFRASNLFSN